MRHEDLALRVTVAFLVGFFFKFHGLLDKENWRNSSAENKTASGNITLLDGVGSSL